MSDLINTIQEMYIGYLGRAADAEGLAYWVEEIESGNLTLEQLRANITNEQPEYINGIGSLTRAQQVEAFYQNLFERAADPEGLEYWVNGDGSAVNADQLVLALINGAAAEDTLVLNNKTSAANYYTDVGGGPDDYTKEDATDSVDTVDSTAQSVKASMDATDAGAQGQPDKFVLTRGLDDIVTFGSDNALVEGIVGAPGIFGTATLTAGDSIQGNSDTDMKLAVTSSITTPFVSVANIGDVDLVGSGGFFAGINAFNWSDIGSVNITAGAPGLTVNVTGLEDETGLAVEVGSAGFLAAKTLMDVQKSLWAATVGDSASILDGDVLIDVADGGSASVDIGIGDFGFPIGSSSGDFGDLELGTIVANVGNGAWGRFRVDNDSNSPAPAGASGDTTVGDIDVTIGNGSWFSASLDTDMGDVNAGNFSATAGVGSGLWYGAEAQTGDVTLGNFDIALAGGTATVTVDGTETGDVTVGDISIAGGMFVSVDISNDDGNGSNNLVVGDVSLSVVNSLPTPSGTSEIELSVFNDNDGGPLPGSNLGGGSLTVGDITLMVGTDGTAEVDISATASQSTDVLSGTFTVGDIDVTLAADATADLSISSDVNTMGDMGDVTIGDVSVMGGIGSEFEIDFDFENNGTGDIGSVVFGDFDINLDDGGDSDIDIEVSTSGSSADVGSVTWGDITATMGVDSQVDDWEIDIDSDRNIGSVTGGNAIFTLSEDGQNTDYSVDVDASGTVGSVMLGDLDVSVGLNGDFSLDVSVSGDLGVGDVSVGDIDLTAGPSSSGDFDVEVDATSGSIGSLEVGDLNIVTMAAPTTNTSSYTFDINSSASASAGTLAVGNINVDVGANTFVSVDIDSWGGGGPGQDADITIGGLTQAGAGTFDFFVGSATYTGDVVIGDITVNLTNTGDLVLNILDGVSTTGTVTIGGVDYSGYGDLMGATSSTIDVTGYLGAPTIIGSAFTDRILDNTFTNAMTGGGGADTFVINAGNMNLTEAKADEITDMTTGVDTIEVTISDGSNVDRYFEASYANYTAFITDAAAQMNGPDEDDIIAGQVGGDVFVAFDMDGGDAPDTVIKLSNIDLSEINFADFDIV